MSDSISRRSLVAGAVLLFPMRVFAKFLPSVRSQELARSLAKAGGDANEVMLPNRGGTRWRQVGSTSLDPAGEGLWWFSDKRGRRWRIAENPLRPGHLGATGRGDERPILQQWANLLGDGVDGQVDQNHMLGGQVTVKARRDFKIGGAGKLSMARSAPVKTGYSPLVFLECTDFEVAGITVDGNRQARPPKEVRAHNIQFQACHRFRATNITSINAVCDGVYIASPTPKDSTSHCSDFIFEGCVIQNCYRQGMSIIQGHRGEIISCVFADTHGTAPQGGVDLESNRTNPEGSIDTITFERCQFVRNRSYGLIVSDSRHPENINVKNCTFEGNHRAPVAWGARSGTITDCRFVGSARANIITKLGAKGEARFRLVRPVIS